MAVEETGLQFRQLAGQQQSVVMTVKSLEPEIDLRNAEVFNRTLFTRDDQIFQQLSDHRVYVDSAPHFIANAALTLAAWRGWSGSLRMRAINHYRLDGDDPSIVASGLTVFDVGAARQLTRTLELNLSLDNLTNRSYRETQNYFESRVTPAALGVARIHATPAYPLTAVAGITMRFGGK
jgi:outer membrane receptor protein involved in Fe transport